MILLKILLKFLCILGNITQRYAWLTKTPLKLDVKGSGSWREKEDKMNDIQGWCFGLRGVFRKACRNFGSQWKWPQRCRKESVVKKRWRRYWRRAKILAEKTVDSEGQLNNKFMRNWDVDSCLYVVSFGAVYGKIDWGARLFMKDCKLERGILSNKGVETRNCKAIERINDIV